jgi:hypothetical protein
MSQSRRPRLRGVISALFKPCYERPLVRDEDSERWAPVVTAAEIVAMDRPRQNLRRPLACSAVAKATPHSGGGPLGANVYHSHP